ncbi:LuxR C-terminal-related transcriptional regulator [Bosea sp. (in: a-proteobacteria)]|jgi:two-component system nitrate/nitrite response regulator NarL|uniref:LuxR C-terminal-related transcriptional regulator n=1 Tax=Bosea sp. (in: a-proteobacteria) TaxID=1871050 RepID=UPI003F721746
MRGIPTVLVEQSTLFREGLCKLLAKRGFLVIAMASSVDELDAATLPDVEAELIIVGAKDDDTWLEKNIRALRTRFPDTQIVVLADRYNPDQVHTAFRLSARGYLMKTISSSTLIKSLELVMLGESIFPSAILTRIVNDHGLDIEIADEIAAEIPPISHSSRTLSAREMQILQCLVRGQSNKMIARSLDIVEATVKVHIKAILRKIQVQNRTQAAIWAINRLEPVSRPINASVAGKANGMSLLP